MNRQKVKELIGKFSDDDWSIALEASDELARNADCYIIQSLIEMLKSGSARIRDLSALALREIKDDNAVVPLLEAISKPENYGQRSTLAYALETLDCSNHFFDIFELVFAKHIDVQISAYNILNEQGFYLDDEDLILATETLEKKKDSIEDKSLIKAIAEVLHDLEN